MVIELHEFNDKNKKKNNMDKMQNFLSCLGKKTHDTKHDFYNAI